MMEPTEFFTAELRSGGWEDFFVLALLVAGTLLAFGFLQARDRHPEGIYSPPLAWLRAGLYFCVVLIVSWLAGVLAAVVGAPLATATQLDDPLWVGLTALCVVLLLWGYVWWWPRGTLTYERRAHLPVQVPFGLAWGACSAQVPLVFWAVLEDFGFGRWWNALLVLVLLAGYSQVYQTGWWDIHVSPPHNIRAWNAKKVLLGHMPFLTALLVHFALFGSAGMFTLFYAAALACAAVAMRFPPFWEADGPAVSRETATGV